MRDVDGLHVEIGRHRIAAVEQRVRLLRHASEQLRVGHQFVERETHGATDIVSGNQGRDECKLEVRFGQELRIRLMQIQEVVDQVAALVFALRRRMTGVDLGIEVEDGLEGSTHGRRPQGEFGKHADDVDQQCAPLVRQ